MWLMKMKLMYPWSLPAVAPVAASAEAAFSPTVAVLVCQVSSPEREWTTFVSKPLKQSRRLTIPEASAAVAVAVAAAAASTPVVDRW
uniref:Putative secreted protein n=1 Tax=Anopheles darlingi TaxID=43151 RepID=A0A2M4DHZ5_ANODA